MLVITLKEVIGLVLLLVGGISYTILLVIDKLDGRKKK